jgi:hypothetical protein
MAPFKSGPIGADWRYFAIFCRIATIIPGWAANWKPIETFLYDWWPLVRRRNLYHRLALANAEIRHHP